MAVGLAAVAAAQPARETAEPVSGEMHLPLPALVTTVGRADGTIVRVISERAGLEGVQLLEDVSAEDLEGIETLIVAMGGSTKGLGAAAIDAGAELERGGDVLEAAHAAGLKVLGVHVGGEARRGELSDPFCELVGNHSDALLVKASGNGDGFFNEIAERRDIPLVEVETNGAAISAIGDLFGIEDE
jgi:hypothetical protein